MPDDGRNYKFTCYLGKGTWLCSVLCGNMPAIGDATLVSRHVSEACFGSEQVCARCVGCTWVRVYYVTQQNQMAVRLSKGHHPSASSLCIYMYPDAGSQAIPELCLSHVLGRKGHSFWCRVQFAAATPCDVNSHIPAPKFRHVRCEDGHHQLRETCAWVLWSCVTYVLGSRRPRRVV